MRHLLLMTFGGTLGRYFSRRFLQAVIAVFLAVVTLILVVDFVELVRRSADAQGATLPLLAGIAFLRAPVYGEQILPFAVLFGSMICFLNLSRRSEIVVAKASGISAWQFLAPILAVALFVGLAFVTVYNPLSAHMKDRADAIEAKAFGKQTSLIHSRKKTIWLRQASIDGESIMRADAATEGGTVLTGVTAYVFDKSGQFLERVEATEAMLSETVWKLKKVRVFTLAQAPQLFDEYLLPTYLGEDQIRESLTSPDTVGFWALPALIDRTRKAGLDPQRYEMQHQILLARPLLLIAMVLLAACFSLRVFRMGGTAKMILGGVSAGFVLYVMTKITGDLGDAGLVAPWFAAWLPAIIGNLTAIGVLLYREDG